MFGNVGFAKKLTSERMPTLQSVVTYLTNQKCRTNYASEVERNCPIGSGVMESACKLLIKSHKYDSLN